MSPKKIARRLYLAGPMRGKPEFNFPAFDDAARNLSGLGWRVFNPADRDRTHGFDASGLTGHEDLFDRGFDLRQALADDLDFITRKADAVAVLPGWEQSSGARAEVATAHALGLPVAPWAAFGPEHTGMPHENLRIRPPAPPSGTIKALGLDAKIVNVQTTEEVAAELGITWPEPSDCGANITHRPRTIIGDDGKPMRNPSAPAPDFTIQTPSVDTGSAWDVPRFGGPPIRIECLNESAAGTREAQERAWLRKGVATALGLDSAPHDDLLADLAAQGERTGKVDGKHLHFEVRSEHGPELVNPGQPRKVFKAAEAAVMLNAGEVRMTSSTGGEKGVKPEAYSLIPTKAWATVARHYHAGAKKYSAHNWRKGYPWSYSHDSAIRHLSAFWGGEDIDTETGSPHPAAVIFHMLTLLTFMEEQRVHDDRYRKPETGKKES